MKSSIFDIRKYLFHKNAIGNDEFKKQTYYPIKTKINSDCLSLPKRAVIIMIQQHTYY